MAKNVKIKRGGDFAIIAAALFFMVGFVFATMRGIDELAALKVDRGGIPEADTHEFYGYQDQVVIMAQLHRREPFFYSSRWQRLLNELSRHNNK